MKNSNLLKITFAPMNQEERAKLEKVFKLVVPVGIFALAIVGGVSYGMGFGLFSLLIDVLFVVAFVTIYRTFKLDLKENEKKIWQGLITDKNYTVQSNKDSRNTYRYYFHFGDQKRAISKDIYDEFNVGDAIEIHLAKRVWGVYFDTKLLKENAMPEVIAAYQSKPKPQGKKASNKIGCFVFLLIALVFGVIMLTLNEIIDLPQLREYLIEFIEGSE